MFISKTAKWDDIDVEKVVGLMKPFYMNIVNTEGVAGMIEVLFRVDI